MKKEKQKKSVKTVLPKNQGAGKKPLMVLWVGVIVALTAYCLSPMLGNGFTNWDDELYVVNNTLLHGPDWKGIFSQSVVSNYHPFTIASLAFNYSVSKLNPHSYLLLNLILHVLNTALVFYFIWNISGKKVFVSALCALIFGIHPMHVESVAWISERKDVLYTFFFLLSLHFYWQYIITEKKTGYWMSLTLFIFSLLSKPAAIILPFILLLLDYWKNRPINKKTIIEKIPFLAAAIVFAAITLQIQSHKAVASLELHPMWERLFFACYVVMIYFVRFIVPYPLSAFHPYPPQNNLGLSILLSPLFIAALAGTLWYFKKNKFFVFGILFFVINLLLVLQIIAIGNTLVSERYTYVPYIGLAFMAGMLIDKLKSKTLINYAVFALIVVVFGSMTYERTHVWKNSGTLWNDAIGHYANAPIPLTNRANYNCKIVEKLSAGPVRDSLLQLSLQDCNTALKYNPHHVKGYENRGLIFLHLNRNQEAVADADSLIKLEPDNKLGYSTRGTAYTRLNEPEKAVADLTKSIELFSGDDFVYFERATVYFNQLKDYKAALDDFERAIQINPRGAYYLYSSYCFANLGDKVKARENMLTAIQMGEKVSDDYQKSLSQ